MTDRTPRKTHEVIVDTRREIKALLDTVGHLAASLLPGTARTWRAPQLSAERRAELDREAREELLSDSKVLPPYLREKQGATAPGESPAPYDLDIMDLLAEILDAADKMADKVAAALGMPPLPPALSALSDPRPALELIHRNVPALVTASPDVAEEIADQCDKLVRRAQEELGLIPDGQLLDALCPSCGGKTGAHPVGGAKTLRIRMLPGSKTMPGRAVVVCEGGQCEPTTAESGIRWRGLPAWDIEAEGAWLSDWINRADEAREGTAT